MTAGSPRAPPAPRAGPARASSSRPSAGGRRRGPAPSSPSLCGQDRSASPSHVQLRALHSSLRTHAGRPLLEKPRSTSKAGGRGDTGGEAGVRDGGEGPGPAGSRRHASLSPARPPQTTRRQTRGPGTGRGRGLQAAQLTSFGKDCLVPVGEFQRSHTCSDLRPRHAKG